VSHILISDQSEFAVREPNGTTIATIALPDGVSQASPLVRPAFARYPPRHAAYVVGWADSNLVWRSAEAALYTFGLTAPTAAPVIFARAGSGRSGLNAGYYTWAHQDGDNVICESNPSPRSNEVTLDDEGLYWASIPATAPDARATHARLYVEVFGEVPAFVAAIPVGTTTYADNVLDTDLGPVLPTTLGLDGTPELDAYARTPVPYCKYVEIFDDCAWYAGDPDHPDRIYRSRKREPEVTNTQELDGTYYTTRGGEPVTGLARHREELLVGTASAIDYIQRVGNLDYRIDRLSSYYNVASHHTMRRVGPNDDLWFLTYQGMALYNGAFQFLMEEIADWVQDLIRANVANWEASWAAISRRFHGYILQVPQADGTTWRLYGDYTPVQYGGQPFWLPDKRTRKDTALGNLADIGGYPELYCGSEDGQIRKEDVLTDGRDDGDALAKKFDATGAHIFRPDQGGDDGHGRSFNDVDVFAKTENQELTVSIYAGDDTAREAASPQDSKVIPAQALAADLRQRVPKTSHTLEFDANGKGAALRFEATAPVGLEIRGFALYDSEGEQVRDYSE
jgi:hypothetical protein